MVMNDNELPLRALSLWQFKFFQINPLSNPFSVSVLKISLWPYFTQISMNWSLNMSNVTSDHEEIIKIRCDIVGFLDYVTGIC